MSQDQNVAKKRGRPKNPAQTMPLIMGTIRSRVIEKLSMSAFMARELRRYVTWASGKIGISETDAMILTLDRCIGDFLKRDKIWQDQKMQPAVGWGIGAGPGDAQ